MYVGGEHTNSVPKPKCIHNRKTIQECRKNSCEHCGGLAYGEPHHIRPRSLGGEDVRLNLIQLCFDCHRAVHDGKLDRRNLIAIVAKREQVDVAEVYKALNWPVPDGSKYEDPAPGTSRLAGMTLDDLIQTYVNLQGNEDDVRWAKGALLVAALDGFGLKPNQAASAFGCSAAQCREMARTFRAFADEGTRIPCLSWYHHRLASKTDDPAGWIARAADNDWSTRQLAEAIKGAESAEARKDVLSAKAERALRYAEEVLKEGGSVAEWLGRKLGQVLAKYPVLQEERLAG